MVLYSVSMMSTAKKAVEPRIARSDQKAINRRSAALLPLFWPILFPSSSIANSSKHEMNKAVDDASSPLVQELLQRTQDMKEMRRKERLDDYYRRNFSDYFSFQESSNMDSQGLSSETQEEIRNWLQQNQAGARGRRQYP